MNFSSTSNLMNGLRINQRNMQTGMQRLSSSLRINSAKDDAAGLAISTRMGAKASAAFVGTRNMQDGISMMQTAEASSAKLQDLLGRARELAVQADNGTLNASDKANIQTEMDGLMAEYDHIVGTSAYNGINLLNNGNTITINPGAGDNVDIATQDLSRTAGGAIDLTGMDLTTAGGAQSAIQKIDSAIDEISAQRATFGSSASRLERMTDFNHTYRNNMEASRSRIQDADMAVEVSNMIKSKLSTETNIAMLQIQNQNQGLLLNLFKL